MARELNMESKQSIEKQTAQYVDCFTTVSDITAAECKQLLDKPVDVVLPNGFENNFVPKGSAFTSARLKARKRLLKIANALTGDHFDKDTMIISTSGRYEFRNKGIDVFIESMNRLRHSVSLNHKVVAFLMVPGWVADAREDLVERLRADHEFDTALDNPRITHNLYNFNEDRVLSMMDYLDMHNCKDDQVKVIFIPTYLVGNDGIVNMPYYDVILGNDLCVYPSYYEPWGYTPLESVAFKVPCITTDLAGFGLWANKVKGTYSEIEDGAKVIHRTDSNLLPNDIMYLRRKYKSVALITRDNQTAEILYEKLKDILPISLLKSTTEEFNKELVVLPAYLAKGLEFDSVVAYSDQNSKYLKTEKNLLYVACTRAQHELIVYS